MLYLFLAKTSFWDASNYRIYHMRQALLILIFSFLTHVIYGKIIYFSSSENEIFRLDPDDFSQTLVTQVNRQIYDISFHPEGGFYGISGRGMPQSSNTSHNLSAENYKVVTLDEIACIDSLPCIIHNNDAPVLDSFISTPATCGQANGTITVLGSGGNGTLMYSLNGGAPQPHNIFTDIPGGQHTITLSDSGLNKDSMTIELLTNNVPVIEAITISPASCNLANGSITISAANGSGFYQYSLDGSSYQLSNVFSNLAAGPYDVHILDDNGCSAMNQTNLPAEKGISISAITTTPTSCESYTGVIEVLMSRDMEPMRYTLNNNPTQSEGQFYDLAAGVYQLYITDGRGCTVDTTLEITKLNCPIYIPNIFSPNGDGVNDLFQIQTAADNAVTITRFYIFDRWGTNVYQKLDQSIHANEGWWDGTFKRFTMNNGSYSYFIEVEFENGDKESFRGSVMLIR